MKKIQRIMITVGLVLFAAGMLALFQGTHIGEFLANKALSANGGSMGTEKYYFMMESYTLSCQLGGTVLAVIGGICAIVFGNQYVDRA